MCRKRIELHKVDLAYAGTSKMNTGSKNNTNNPESSSSTQKSVEQNDSETTGWKARKHRAATHLLQKYPPKFEFPPFDLAVLVILPSLLYYFELSLWLYIPCTVCYMLRLVVMCLMHKAEFKDLSIVQEPAVLHRIKQFAPSWLHDSDVNQAGWFNWIIQGLWPKISEAKDILYRSAYKSNCDNVSVISRGDNFCQYTLTRLALPTELQTFQAVNLSISLCP